MNPAYLIAQRLYEAGIRMATIEDYSMALSTPDHLHVECARLYLDNRSPVEVEVRSDQAKQIGPEQAYYRSGWLVMTDDDDFMRDVDSALWEIQQQAVAEQKAESRNSLFQERAA